MKPFALHAVLKYRRQLEDAAQKRLFQAQETEAKLKEALLLSEEELAELYTGLQRENEQGITVDRLTLFDRRIDLVKEQTAQRKAALEKQQFQVAKKRQQLIKASKDRKIIEKLEEQQNAAYKKHIEKKEAGMLDEIAVLSHERKQR
jgi:flagellar FliJ protein